MKIAQIVYSGLSGVNSVAFSLVEADRKKEIDWIFVFYGIEELLDDYRQKCETLGIKCIFLKKKVQGSVDVSSHGKLFNILKKEQPDGIISHASVMIFTLALYARFNKKCKIITTEHHANHLKRKSQWWLSKQFLRFSDSVVYLHEEYSLQIQKKYPHNFRDEKVHIIPNGLDLQVFRPLEKETDPSSKKSKSKEFLIGMAARFYSSKDVPTIFRTMQSMQAEFPDEPIRFLLAGSGEMLEEWQDLAKELGIDQQVDFLGYLSEKALLEMLHKLHIYVHSTRGETMSMTIMQAQACGLPIIASNVSGVRKAVLPGNTGLLFDFGNQTELQDSIRALQTDPQKRKYFGANSLKWASDNYSNETMLKNYLKLISPLL